MYWYLITIITEKSNKFTVWFLTLHEQEELSFHISFTMISPLLISAFFCEKLVWINYHKEVQRTRLHCRCLIIAPSEQCAWNVHLFLFCSSLAYFRQHQNAKLWSSTHSWKPDGQNKKSISTQFAPRRSSNP